MEVGYTVMCSLFIWAIGSEMPLKVAKLAALIQSCSGDVALVGICEITFPHPFENNSWK